MPSPRRDRTADHNTTPEGQPVLLLSRITWNRAYPTVRIRYGHG